jgi:hypothetical protein
VTVPTYDQDGSGRKSKKNRKKKKWVGVLVRVGCCTLFSGFFCAWFTI